MNTLSRSYREELLKRLKDNNEAAEYLQAALEESQGAFLVALKNVLDARKVAVVARASNVNREHIYQMLTKDGNPTLSTLERILHALGLRLAINSQEVEDYETKEENYMAGHCWHGSWNVSPTASRRKSVYQDALHGSQRLPNRTSKEEGGSPKSVTLTSISACDVFADTELCYEMAY